MEYIVICAAAALPLLVLALVRYMLQRQDKKDKPAPSAAETLLLHASTTAAFGRSTAG
jgi:hypothetical protein